MNANATYRLLPVFFQLLFGFSLLFALTPAYGQNGPKCFQLFFPSVEANTGDTVCLPVRVRQFDMISSMQFAVYYDAAAFDFAGIDVSGSLLPGFGVVNYNLSAPGYLKTSWFDQTANSVTLPDSAVLFSVCLKVKTNSPGFYPLHIDGGPGFPFEVIQMVLIPPDWVFFELPLAQQIGGVSLGTAVPAGDLAVTSTCVAKSTCGAAVGGISLEVTGGQAPYTYAWSGPNGFSASAEDLSGLSGGVYTVTVTDQNGLTVSAQAVVAATASGVYVQKSLTPAICGQANGCATLTLFGGQLPYQFVWSAGTSQTDENCDLPPGIHTVSITDASGCTRIDTFEIQNDTVLNVNLATQHIYDCNGTGSVTITPGNYLYAWSGGGAAAMEDSLYAGVYEVTVTAPGGCSVVVYPWIVDYSTQYWNLSLLTACDDPVSVPTGRLRLKYNPNGGVAFPAIVSWSDGSTRMIPQKPAGNILDSLTGVTSGLYSATVTDAEGCSRSVQQVLNCTPPLPVPDSLTAFYIQDDYLTPQYAVDSCVGVYARYFTEVSGLGMTLEYNPSVVTFNHLKFPGNPLNLTPGGNFNVNTLGEIKFSWTDPAANGVSLPENSLLFEVCLTPNTTTSYYNMKFTGGDLADYRGVSPFLGKNGYVLFGLYFPLGPSVCDYAAEIPSCASDGYGRIFLGGCDPGDVLNGYYYHNDLYYNSLSGLAFADSGSYEISVSQTAQLTNTFYAHIPGTLDAQPCVWPGDADDNNAVNHHDLLYIGLAYGATGMPRNAASLEWLGQDAPDWQATTTVRNINFKNMDANGDGVIDAADTLGIVQNWGRVVNPARHDPFNAPLGNPTGNTQPPFTIAADTLAPGQMVALPLLLGSQDMPADSVYGLAFSISYDPAKVNSNISFQPTDSWFGTASQMLWLQKNFPEQGRLDISITRLDGMPVSGWGPIGDVFVIIEDDIFFGPSNPDADFFGDTLLKTLLFFSGINPVHADEATFQLDAPPVELVILQSTSVSPEIPSWERHLVLSPNPASTEIRISSPEAGIRRLEMVDITGVTTLVREENGAASAVIPVQGIHPGTYFVRLFTDEGIALKKVHVAR